MSSPWLASRSFGSCASIFSLPLTSLVTWLCSHEHIRISHWKGGGGWHTDSSEQNWPNPARTRDQPIWENVEALEVERSDLSLSGYTIMGSFLNLFEPVSSAIKRGWYLIARTDVCIKFLAHNRHLINGSSSYYFKNSMNTANRSLLTLEQRELNI